MKGKTIHTVLELPSGKRIEMRAKAIPSYSVIAVKRERQVGVIWFSLMAFEIVKPITGVWSVEEKQAALWLARKKRDELYPYGSFDNK